MSDDWSKTIKSLKDRIYKLEQKWQSDTRVPNFATSSSTLTCTLPKKLSPLSLPLSDNKSQLPSVILHNPPLYWNSCIEERGTVYLPQRLSSNVWFQTLSIWLLVLEPTFINKIHFPQFKSFSHLFNHLKTNNLQSNWINLKMHHLLRKNFLFNSTALPPSLNLVSGNIEFWHDIHPRIDTHSSVFITEMHKRWRRLPFLLSLSIRQITHESVGGCTTYQSLFSFPLIPNCTKLC